jgi:hypothetical protein
MSSPLSADIDFEIFSTTSSSSSPASTSGSPQIIQAIWDNRSLDMWITSGETDRLHHKSRFNYPVGTIVLCINKDTRSIFGVATITGECMERCLLDQPVYTGDYEMYKFECKISFRMFAAPIKCEIVSVMCGTAKRSWFYHLSMRTCYLAGVNPTLDADVKARFIQLVNYWI